jgi:hypothetical protein
MVDQKGEMGIKRQQRWGGRQKTKAQDNIPSENPLGKMLKYWDDSFHTKVRREQGKVK